MRSQQDRNRATFETSHKSTFQFLKIGYCTLETLKHKKKWLINDNNFLSKSIKNELPLQKPDTIFANFFLSEATYFLGG